MEIALGAAAVVSLFGIFMALMRCSSKLEAISIDLAGCRTELANLRDTRRGDKA